MKRILFLSISLTVIFGLIFIYGNFPKTVTMTVLDKTTVYFLTPFTPVPEAVYGASSNTIGDDRFPHFSLESNHLPDGTKIFNVPFDRRFIMAEIDGKPALYAVNGASPDEFEHSYHYTLLDIIHNSPFSEAAAYLVAYQCTDPIATYNTVAFNLDVPDDVRPDLELMLTELGERSRTNVIFDNDFINFVEPSPEHIWMFRPEYGSTCYVYLKFKEYRGDDMVIYCDCVYGSLGGEGKGLLIEPTDNGWSVKQLLFTGIS